MLDLQPQLAKAVDVVPHGPDWRHEFKLDGWRAMVHRTAEGVSLYGGRNGSDYSGQLPYLATALEFLPHDTVLDGELVGHEWGQVQGVMTGGYPHSPSVHDPALTFVIFDMLRMGGRDMTQMSYLDRHTVLEVFDADHVEVAVAQMCMTQRDANTLLEDALRAGYEGLVSKNIRSRYSSGRSGEWVKIKPQQTAEAKIVGFKPGKAGGKFAGKCGAFELEMLDSGAKTTCKCGTDERHQDATDAPELWLGKVIEILHHGIGKDGVPRHPQFHRLRSDRVPNPAKRTVSAQPMRARNGKGSGRNYRAMKDEKLRAPVSTSSRPAMGTHSPAP